MIAAPDAAALGARLATAWRTGAAIGDVPALADLDEAERVQDAMLHALGEPAAAWKLGAGTHSSREALGLDRCFSGLVPADRTLLSPARLDGPVRIECELAVRLARDVSGGAALADDDVSLVASLHPAIEVPGSRFADAPPDAHWLVADNGAVRRAIVGEAAPADLLGRPVAVMLAFDGLLRTTGALDALVDPPLTLLVDHLRRIVARGHVARAGEYVLLGGLTPLVEAPCGTEVVADFGPIGTVSLSVS